MKMMVKKTKQNKQTNKKNVQLNELKEKTFCVQNKENKIYRFICLQRKKKNKTKKDRSKMPGENYCVVNCGTSRKSKSIGIFKLPSKKRHEEWREKCLGEIKKNK